MPSEEKHVVSTAVCMKLRTKENSPLNNVIRFIRYGDRYNTTEEKPDEDICNRWQIEWTMRRRNCYWHFDLTDIEDNKRLYTLPREYFSFVRLNEHFYRNLSDDLAIFNDFDWISPCISRETQTFSELVDFELIKLEKFLTIRNIQIE